MLRTKIYDRSDPLRPVDWRHRRAGRLLDQNRHACLRREDVETQKVYRFLRRQRQCRTERDVLTLSRSMPEVSGAFNIYESPHPAIRAGIEARLLAGQSATEIAKRVGVTRSTIQAFSDTFFDVADRLSARDFILNHVISASRASKQPHANWKYIAYVGGPDLLESIMYGAPLQSGFIGRRDLAQGLAESTDLVARHGIAEKVQSSTDLRLAGQLQGLCGKAGVASGQEQEEDRLDEYQQSIAVLTDGLPFRVHRPGISDDDIPEEIKQFERRGIMLRAGELVLFGLNGSLPDVEMLMSAKYPETK